MRAVTVRPGEAGSVELSDMHDPTPGVGELLVEGLAVGVCGTDREILTGGYGQAPPGKSRLVLGHESLGRVLEAPADSAFTVGDLVVGVVRRPDPHPCGACAVGEFDMCRNGEYVERGITGLHGYASTAWTVPAEYAVRLDPALGTAGVLLEPTSVVAKAWEQIDRIGDRSWFEPQTVLVAGAGPIGLLAAMIGVQRGLRVHLVDRADDGPKPAIAQALGAVYHAAPLAEVASTVRPDILIEATGAAPVVADCLNTVGPYGIVVLTGVSAQGERTSLDLGGINRALVLGNAAVVGSVNANLRHYAQAAAALRAADRTWLLSLLTRRVPLDRWREAFEPAEHDVKVVLELRSGGG